jgi:hypothetical protein
MKKALVLTAIVAAIFGTSIFNPAPAHATLTVPAGDVLGSTVYGTGPYSDQGTLACGVDCERWASNGVTCETITIRRFENYWLTTTTDYEAHLQVCREWNMAAFGGVVYNVSWRMWVDHLKPTINWGGGVLSAGHYEYACLWHSGQGTQCANKYSFRVDAGTAVQQCLAFCVQTESISAWMVVYYDGEWIGDLTTN